MEKNYLEIILEDMNGKFALVLEGHQVLRNDIERTREELLEKIEDNSIAIRFLNKKIEEVNEDLGAKIDAVAADLKCHREDTEIHTNYRVSEGKN